MKELIHASSAKRVFRIEPGRLTFEFTDFFSVFGYGKHQQAIPGKGKALCDAAVHSFNIATRVGVNTHFIERENETTIHVQELPYIVPLKWTRQYRLTERLRRVFQNNLEYPTEYGFPDYDVPPEGVTLPFPILRLLSDGVENGRPLPGEEILSNAGLSTLDTERIWSLITRLDGCAAHILFRAGYYHVGGAIQIGMGPRREMMLVDTFLTQDTDDFIAITPFDERGMLEHHSRDLIREIFIKKEFLSQLEAARDTGTIPPYPTLREDEIELISSRYQQFSKDYMSIPA